MPNNEYSTTCLVGRFNAKEGLSYQELEKDNNNWERNFLTEDKLDNLKRKYYPAHVNAMIDTGGDSTMVHCYRLAKNLGKDLTLKRVWYDEQGNENSKDYQCKVEDVLLWFFPNEIVLFSIKFVDSKVDLNDLRWMHA